MATESFRCRFLTSRVRVRIAPSPTGHLHVGTARTALYNYLYARRHGGDFIMRLEDTDQERSDELFTEDIISGLKWLNLDWDEGPDKGGPYAPYRQTQKTDHYEQVAHKLVSQGAAYFCYASAEELEALRELQRNSGESQRYDNRGRHYSDEQMKQFAKEGRVPVIRFKVDDDRTISWHDGIKGDIQIHAGDLGGDMVIIKSSGIAVYNFAVVVDDIDMKMTHVIRGEDHIHNTAKQLLLYEALGVTPPKFAHVPLMLDLDRQKLSKRKHGEAVHVDKYRRDGFMPEALVNYLAQMSWSPAEGKEIFSLEEGCALFDLDRVSKSPAVFDTKKLEWFNAHYIKSLPIEQVTERALPFLQGLDIGQYSKDELEKIVALMREGVSCLSQLPQTAAFFFDGNVELKDDATRTLLKEEKSRQVLSRVASSLEQFPWTDAKGNKALVDQIGKELGVKGKELYGPIRAALSGTISGPDLGTTLSILGKARVRSRIEALLQLC